MQIVYVKDLDIYRMKNGDKNEGQKKTHTSEPANMPM